METLSKPAAPQIAPLTPEERLDLRKRVLSGQPLTLEEARAVIDSFRVAQGKAMIEGAEKVKRPKREAITDDQLDAKLDALGL